MRFWLNLLVVYKFLPRTNFNRYDQPACMGFAAKLIEEETSIQNCSPLFDYELCWCTKTASHDAWRSEVSRIAELRRAYHVGNDYRCAKPHNHVWRCYSCGRCFFYHHHGVIYGFLGRTVREKQKRFVFSPSHSLRMLEWFSTNDVDVLKNPVKVKSIKGIIPENSKYLSESNINIEYRSCRKILQYTTERMKRKSFLPSPNVRNF